MNIVREDSSENPINLLNIQENVNTFQTEVVADNNNSANDTYKKHELRNVETETSESDENCNAEKETRDICNSSKISNSTEILCDKLRRVSFPKDDKKLVTGYLEPANPWAKGIQTKF